MDEWHYEAEESSEMCLGTRKWVRESCAGGEGTVRNTSGSRYTDVFGTTEQLKLMKARPK